MASAREATSGMLEPDSDDEDSDSSRRSSMMGAPAAVAEEDLAPLVAAAKRARVAGSTAPQVDNVFRKEFWCGMSVVRTRETVCGSCGARGKGRCACRPLKSVELFSVVRAFGFRSQHCLACWFLWANYGCARWLQI